MSRTCSTIARSSMCIRRRSLQADTARSGLAPSVSAWAMSSSRPGARAWSALGILCFVYVLNFLDRQLLSILAKPIQDELHVTDGQIGRISGLYFALFYC